MLVIGGLILGAIIGGWRARRMKGRPADIAQYAIVHAMALGLLGLILSVAIERLF